MTQQRTDYRQVKTFRDTYKSLEGVYDMFPKLCGLSGTEYWALAMIEEGISTQYGICHHLSISRQTVNSAFRKLKKRGMIHLETMDENLKPVRFVKGRTLFLPAGLGRCLVVGDATVLKIRC